MLLTIELQEALRPIAGRIRGPGMDRTFSSWLGLMTALREIVDGASTDDTTGSEAACPD